VTTYTLLISFPDDQAPTAASDLADHVRVALEVGRRGRSSCPFTPYKPATVDALRGDWLDGSKTSRNLRAAHRAIAGVAYAARFGLDVTDSEEIDS
jgi:hypothetical protein